MKNKKGFILNIGTVVILVLSTSMLILGVVLVKNIISEPEFKITKERIIVAQEVYDYCNNYCNNSPGISMCVQFPCSNLIEEVEVEEIEFEVESGFIECGNKCTPYLTIEWLDENCKCRDCEGTWDTVYDDYVTCDIKCSEWKCGEYKVEVL